MISRVRSVGLSGLNGMEISVECFLSQGLPAFDVVGLPDAAVREARERVRAAMKVSGYNFPVRRITVSLAPADVRKAGSAHDLPILLGLLAAMGDIDAPSDKSAFLGELSLKGELRPVTGVLPMAMEAAKRGFTELFLPADNALEASLVRDIKVYPASYVSEVIAHLSGREPLTPAVPYVPESFRSSAVDFSEVRGQDNVKRSLEIAAAGGHNVLLIGPPGSGKSMLARRLPSILPDMSWEEALESTAIYSISGLTDSKNPLLSERPFRSPHHTISSAALSGGGRNPRPGEMSLSHNGVLFLDELPEFHRDTLEAMRQPLEDGIVTVSRVAGTNTYPARFMLVCAMNPCKCGWYGHPSGKCVCSPESVKSYFGRISGPLLDRIDIQTEVPSVTYEEISQKPKDAETSEMIRERVNKARKLQAERYSSPLICNAHMTPKHMEDHCVLDEAGQSLIRSAFGRLSMTARSYNRILKVARTIADLDNCEIITSAHLAEALQFRQLKR